MNLRDRIMYFSTGDGVNASGEAYAAPVNKLRRILPVSTTTLDLVIVNQICFSIHKGGKLRIFSCEFIR